MSTTRRNPEEVVSALDAMRGAAANIHGTAAVPEDKKPSIVAEKVTEDTVAAEAIVAGGASETTQGHVLAKYAVSPEVLSKFRPSGYDAGW